MRTSDNQLSLLVPSDTCCLVAVAAVNEHDTSLWQAHIKMCDISSVDSVKATNKII